MRSTVLSWLAMPKSDKNVETTTCSSSWCVYIVRCADDSLYTGISTDVAARINRHNLGRGAKYTRGRLPVELVYQETSSDQGSALRREYEIKQMSPKQKRALLV